MTQLHPVTVNILDKEYHVGCPAAERANLESAARFLDEKMREVRDAGKVFGIERIAVLTALNLSYEMLQNQPGNSGQERASREQASDLLERIDRELHGDDPALRRQQLKQEQAARTAQVQGRPQVMAPTPVVAAPVEQPPAVEVPAAAEPLQAIEPPRQLAPWEQNPLQPPFSPEPQSVPEPQEEYRFVPEQAGWQEPQNAWQEPQDAWQEPEQQQNPQQIPGHNQWVHHEEQPSGDGLLDGGPDFRLPPN